MIEVPSKEQEAMMRIKAGVIDGTQLALDAANSQIVQGVLAIITNCCLMWVLMH